MLLTKDVDIKTTMVVKGGIYCVEIYTLDYTECDTIVIRVYDLFNKEYGNGIWIDSDKGVFNGNDELDLEEDVKSIIIDKAFELIEQDSKNDITLTHGEINQMLINLNTIFNSGLTDIDEETPIETVDSIINDIMLDVSTVIYTLGARLVNKGITPTQQVKHIIANAGEEMSNQGYTFKRLDL